MIDSQIVLFTLISIVVLDIITAAARSSLNNVHVARLLQMSENIGGNIDRAIALKNAYPRPQMGLLLAQTFLRFLFAGLILLLIPWWQTTWHIPIAIAILIGSTIVFAMVEWIIDGLVAHNAEKWVVRLALPIQVLSAVLFPLMALTRIFYQDLNAIQSNSSIITEDELITLVDAGQKDGVFEQDERKMIHSVFKLGDTLTREIMVPRIDILALDVHTPLPEAVDALLKTGYSRVPIYEDTVDNVIGVLYAKDLLKVWREGEKTATLVDLLREAYFVPEAKMVDELFTEMQSRRVHLGIVVDEYGGVAGLVAMEDIVEEIFGEIQDEYDDEELLYQLEPGGDFLFLGRIDIDDFNEIMGCNLPNDEADTLGGFIYGRLGHVPTNGENVSTDEILLTVEQVTARRIRKVRASWLTKEEPPTIVD